MNNSGVWCNAWLHVSMLWLRSTAQLLIIITHSRKIGERVLYSPVFFHFSTESMRFAHHHHRHQIFVVVLCRSVSHHVLVARFSMLRLHKQRHQHIYAISAHNTSVKHWNLIKKEIIIIKGATEEKKQHTKKTIHPLLNREWLLTAAAEEHT